MRLPLQRFTAEHRYLLEAAGRQAGLAAPIAVQLDEFYEPLLKAARKGAVLPIEGVLVRDWDPDTRRTGPGVDVGLRLYEIDGVRFVQVHCHYDKNQEGQALNFWAVARADYRRFYRAAVRCRRDAEPPSTPPVLPPEQLDLLWKNTIGYLDRSNLRRIKAYGGRPKRGLLLTGAPGNGKTMACRWVWEECRRRRWDWRLVTHDEYRQARASCDAKAAVAALFEVDRRGIVFFDDMDLALRDRETVRETDDQAVFLSALDGISTTEGVVYVFTTNCALGLIDAAFKRPGRIDVVLRFKPPDAELRRRLIARWHADIRRHIDPEEMVATTRGYSFAEVEELKKLLIMQHMDSGAWDWGWALRQFAVNRDELTGPRRHVGFGLPAANGCA